MEEDHGEDESPKDFRFPMSKHDKLTHAHFESNICSIIDDEDESTGYSPVKEKVQPIIVQPLSSNDDDEFEVQGITNKIEAMTFQTEERSIPDENSQSPIKSSLSKKKLNILSNNYKPTDKVVKKGKLKKPQSQKEPNLKHPRDFGAGLQPHNYYTGAHIVDNPRYYPGQCLIGDEQEHCGISGFMSNIDRSTSSSLGSGGYGNYQHNMGHYIHPGYNMYHNGYYPSVHHQPPGLGRHPNNIIPRQSSTPGYNDYLPSPNIVPPSLASSKSALETVSS